MGLVSKQNRFAICITRLEAEIARRGIVYTRGDAFRSPMVFGAVGEKKGYGHPYSCHKYKLAQDLNLFLPDGSLVEDDTYHRELHDWWIVNCGGAKMIKHDPNHYSFDHKGCR